MYLKLPIVTAKRRIGHKDRIGLRRLALLVPVLLGIAIAPRKACAQLDGYTPTTPYSAQGATEFKSKSTYLSGSTWGSWPTRHVARFNMQTATVSSTGTIQDSANVTQTLTLLSAGYVVAIANPNGIGMVTGSSSTNYHSGNVVVTGKDSSGAPIFAAGVSVDVAPGTVVPLDLPATGTISSATANSSLTLVETWKYHDTNHGDVTFTDTTYWVRTLSYAKDMCGDASIDTRKAYSNPDQSGHYPGDANGSLRPINFGSWIYSGGLFVGNIAYLNNDQSGTARIQLWDSTSAGSGTFEACCISLFDMGVPNRPYVTGNFTVGFYGITGSTNSTVTESQATWDLKWPVDTTGTAISTVTFPTPTGDYKDYQTWNVPSGSASGHYVLAIAHDEDGTGGGGIWRYLASKEYQGDHSGDAFPICDSAPRVWMITSTEGTGAWFQRQ